MEELFLPVLSHFQNENPWSASAGRLHYLITPVIPTDESKLPVLEGATLTVEVWEGPWAYEFSTVEAVETFPLTQEGLEAIPAWLERWHQEVESRPQRTLEENIARRREPQVPEKE